MPSPEPGTPGWAHDVAARRWLRACLLQCGVFLAAWIALVDVESVSRAPVMWPAAGLIAGASLTSPRSWRPWMLVVSLLALLAAHALHDYPIAVALGFSASSVAAAYVTRRLLTHGLDATRASLLSEGDVSRMIGAVAAGAAAAAVGYALTGASTGTGNALLGGVAAFGAHAAALVVLLPVFLETPWFAPLAQRRERVVQSLILVAASVAVFTFAQAPLLIFAVMPMFAWLAFRGTLREATALLVLVGTIGTVLTAMQVGPIWDATSRYDIPAELAAGVLQLFLLDCGLMLLPLSVMATQQRIAAASAAAEREKLDRLVALASGTVVMVTGAQGRVVAFNPAAEEMLGLRAADVLGELPDTFLSRSELERHAAALGADPTFEDICRASVGTGDTDRLWGFRRSDGEMRSMRMTLTLIPADRGTSPGYLATGQDVTEREAAQQALLLSLQHERDATDRLLELDRVKADLVAAVSHELRTPITSILGYLELLEDGAAGDLTDAQRTLVARVDRNGHRLLGLVEDLLTHSQIESSRLVITRTPTDLRHVVVAAHEAVRPILDVRALQVVVETPRRPVVGDVDPVQLERMLVNLLTNAIKFTPDGGRIDVGLTGSDTAATLVVADTGLGIPEHEQGRLFTRFFRSSTATEQAIQGAGLGLAIVQAIVAEHDGTIAVDSRAGAGTTFTVHLSTSNRPDRRPEPTERWAGLEPA